MLLRQVRNPGGGNDARAFYLRAALAKAGCDHCRNPTAGFPRIRSKKDLRRSGAIGKRVSQSNSNCKNCPGIEWRFSRHPANSVRSK
jgi:ribosomal protein L34E